MFTDGLTTIGYSKFAWVVVKCASSFTLALLSRAEHHRLCVSISNWLQPFYPHCYYPFSSPISYPWEQKQPTSFFVMSVHLQLCILFPWKWSMLLPNWNAVYFLVMLTAFQTLCFVPQINPPHIFLYNLLFKSML